MGWLSPVVIVVKILLQSLWLLKVSWDEVLPIEIIDQWTLWQEQINTLSSLKFPRWVQYSPHREIIELHGFADALTSRWPASPL